MKNIKEKIIKNKIQILYTALTGVLCLVLGFYGGRYYETQIIRKNFADRRGTFIQQRQGGGTYNNQQPSMDGPRFHQ